MGIEDSAAVALRIAKDGTVQRVPLVFDEHGSAGETLREQIGCRLFQLIALDDGLDLWVDEESLVLITGLIGGPLRQPIFGVAVFTGRAGANTAGLSPSQLRRVEGLAALSAGVLVTGDAVDSSDHGRPLVTRSEAAHVGGGH